MKKICFLLPEGAVMPSMMLAAIETFEAANELLGEAFYDMKIIGVPVRQPLQDAQISILPGIKDYKKAQPDLIIIPGLHWRNGYYIKENKVMLEWLVRKYKNGCEIASLCTGSFFLAATGLLNGKECSTHWRGTEMFLEMYPAVKLCSDKIITDNSGLYTSGGANSSLNLILYLIEKYNSRETAVLCSKIMQIDIERNSQSQFIRFEGQKGHDDDVISRVQTYIERHTTERLTVEFLAKKFAMSRRSFIRRFKHATKNTPIEYIQRVKIEAAKRSLERRKQNVNEVMYSIGYNDLRSFRTIFKKITGMTPVDYHLKFSGGSQVA